MTIDHIQAALIVVLLAMAVYLTLSFMMRVFGRG